MITRRIIRSVPRVTSPEVDAWWQLAKDLHPGWDFADYRDPLDPAWFPLTSPSWPLCGSGAQLAGLVRLEALWGSGGFWLDSDVELYRSLESLTPLKGFACYEDATIVPDAVLGFEPEHPAVGEMLRLALDRIAPSNTMRWPEGRDAWSTGPGVTTTVLPGRDDVLLLPPQSFFAVHHSGGVAHANDVELDAFSANPPGWAFGLHRWHASWL